MSVRWSAFLKPLFAEEYTFLVQVNDGIKVWIDDAILIDEFSLMSMMKILLME